MDLWFGLLKENIEANGGTAIAPENFTRVKVSSTTIFGGTFTQTAYDTFLSGYIKTVSHSATQQDPSECGHLLIHLVN